ncbi:helix-turn-helix transcriptional regulator [Furfurilactobacillus milii]|uniref:HTH cro/C1-type domain-containing protein n=1 Tax=Furfurilactobacillus milii TaxID=2888272 RepID=A0A6N9HYW6_9LACO|nr:helix-turn-helix transcriptional regulator [Furfurilactobacillus milii]MYV16052.1 hypothetical protein [Furfurilactobacillus milii]
MLNGHIIRDARLKLHLSQAELAKGVTNKETVGFIEHNMVTPRAKTINGILKRLNLKYEDVVAEKNHDANFALKDIEKLIMNRQYQAALSRLKSLNVQTLTSHTKLEVDFLTAFADLKLTQNYNQAIFEYNRSITGSNTKSTDIFSILIIEQLGMIYSKQGKKSNARFYLDQIPRLLQNSGIDSSSYWFKFIYHDLSQFYAQANKKQGKHSILNVVQKSV